MDKKARKNPGGTMPLEAERTPSQTASEEGGAPFEPRTSPPDDAIPAPSLHLRETAGSAKEVFTSAGFAELAGRSSVALQRSQAALVQGFEELSVEFAAIARSSVESAARRATEMLEVKTLPEALDLHFSFARDSLEAFVGGSLRMAELGVEVARKAAEPFFAELLSNPF